MTLYCDYLVKVDNEVTLDVELDSFFLLYLLDQVVTSWGQFIRDPPKVTKRFAKNMLEISLVIVFQLFH